MRTTALHLRALLSASLPCAVALLAGCAADMPSESEPSTEPVLGEKHEAVIGGTAAGDCQWPTTVRVDPAQCSGTLIHPRVVTTAAHCISGTTATIGFGARGASTSFSVSARCVAGARGSTGVATSKDWAYCVLPDDPRIAKLPVTPPLVGCEAALVKAGDMAWVVGYGATTPRGSVGGKRQVEVKINQFNKLAPGTIDIGDRYVGACHGDSGGPLYVKVTKGGVDYGWRTLGSTSGAGGNCDCTCSTTYVNIDNHVKAIEKNEGIDVTPCTDADGQWAPSAACAAFESAPASGTGTFPQCVVERVTGPIETCGAGVSPPAADAGATGDAGARSDAGGLGDAGWAADAGAALDAGERFDAGNPFGGNLGADAAIATDGSIGAARGDAGRALDAAVALADAGSFADAAPTGMIPSTVTGGFAQDPDDDGDGGCSTAAVRGRPSALGLALLALAFARVRRRKPR